MKACAVVVAAGRGRRFGGARPKQFLPLRGQPLLYWSLRAFERTAEVSTVVLVLAEDAVAWGEAFVRRRRLRKVLSVVAGGEERSDSVRNGVAAAPRDADVVLVHDAARALITPDVIRRVARAALKTGAALAAWPVPDTLKSSSPAARRGGRVLVKRTVPRRDMWLAQTPQAFRRDVAGKLFSRRRRGLTDDVQLAERAGFPVELVPAAPSNIKLTTPEDFRLCRALLAP